MAAAAAACLTGSVGGLTVTFASYSSPGSLNIRSGATLDIDIGNFNGLSDSISVTHGAVQIQPGLVINLYNRAGPDSPGLTSFTRPSPRSTPSPAQTPTPST